MIKFRRTLSSGKQKLIQPISPNIVPWHQSLLEGKTKELKIRPSTKFLKFARFLREEYCTMKHYAVCQRKDSSQHPDNPCPKSFIFQKGKCLEPVTQTLTYDGALVCLISI